MALPGAVLCNSNLLQIVSRGSEGGDTPETAIYRASISMTIVVCAMNP
jgi:hypothetical protein